MFALRSNLIGLLAGILAITGVGCVAAHGNKDIQDTTKLKELKVGMSTKDDAVKLFGPPTHTDLRDSGSVQWIYNYERSQERVINVVPVVGAIAGGVDTQTATLTLLFDSQGVLRNMDSGSATGGRGGIQDLGK